MDKRVNTFEPNKRVISASFRYWKKTSFLSKAKPPSSPFQCWNMLPGHLCGYNIILSTLKRGRGRFGFRQKRVFFQLRKDADITRLFGSNVSTRLSMIVASWGISILNISAFLLLIGFDIMDISFDQWFPLIIEKFHWSFYGCPGIIINNNVMETSKEASLDLLRTYMYGICI